MHTSLRLAMIASLLATILSATPLAQETISPGWEVGNVGFATKPAFDFGPDGRLHVMGMTEDFSGFVWHAAADSVAGPWPTTILAAGYFYGPGDIRVDPGGDAHLAWHNHTEQDPNHGVVDNQGGVTVYRIDTPTNHNGWDNSLALDAQGGLHMASVDPSGFGASFSLEYSTFDGSAWTYNAVQESDAFMYGFNTALGIDSAGNPHIAYCAASNWTEPGDLRYAVRDGGTWQVSSIVSGGIRGRFPSLVIDGANRPHVSWLDLDEGAQTGQPTAGTVRYAVLDGGAWQVQDVARLENVLMGFNHARKSTSIALDSDDGPTIAYADQRGVMFARRINDAWLSEPVLEHQQDIYKGLVVLRIGPADIAGLVMWQAEDSQPGLIRIALRRDPVAAELSSFAVE